MATWCVVGSNRGIGLEMVRQLQKRGDTVLAACRKASPELRATNAELIEGVDVTTDDGVRALGEKLAGRSLDGLVVVSGVLRRVPLDNLDVNEIRSEFETNALGPLRVVHAALGSLKEGSKIALITSRMGSIADNTSGGHYAYRMSKAALNMAAKSLSIDLKGRGVAVCLLHPGFVRTEMTGGHGDVDPEVAAERLLQRIDALSVANTGTWWHANGDVLPW
jgi:NAD(P)-dependent dehydrogenase (short-subunit alcohol dehydrogenase family)